MIKKTKDKKDYHVERIREVPEAFKSLVHDIPDFLRYLPVRGTCSLGIAKLAEALKSINCDQCVTFAPNEFNDKFGESPSDKRCKYILTRLKSMGVLKPRYHIDDARVYFWRNP